MASFWRVVPTLGALAGICCACTGGASSTPVGSAGTGGGICKKQAFTGLSVTRTIPIPGNNITFDFPDEITSNDGARIGSLAATACHIPHFPEGLAVRPILASHMTSVS
jgi:hypothetical protein